MVYVVSLGEFLGGEWRTPKPAVSKKEDF